MAISSNALVYEFRTRVSAATQASVRAFVLGILKVERVDDRNVWIVATTPDQGMLLNGRPGVINPRKIGMMFRVGDELIFKDPSNGETLPLSIEALEG